MVQNIEDIICRHYHSARRPAADVFLGKARPCEATRHISQSVPFQLDSKHDDQLRTALLLTVSYSILAKQYSRRLVLSLSILGICLACSCICSICRPDVILPLAMVL